MSMKNYSKQKYTWSSIIPLIGGMSIGMQQAFNSKPEYILSYKPFKDNDSNILNYWQDVPYYQIDSDDKLHENLYVDVVNTVCPCAGLSMFNSSKNRGADAAVNDWLYTTANYVLENIKPKVFWGENAPALITKTGDKVKQNLKNIGKKYGYSFSIVKTNTILHGLPQKRERTFYFFWKDSSAPILSYKKTLFSNLKTFLANIDKTTVHYTEYTTNKKLSEDYFYRYIVDNNIDKNINLTAFKLVYFKGLYNEFIKSINPEDTAYIEKCEYCKAKLDKDMNIWDFGTPHFSKDYVRTIYHRYMINAAHPTEDRYLNVREIMSLMGLPEDFNLVSNNYNHICQNVPVTTAKYFSNQIIDFLNGNISLSNDTYLEQVFSNKKLISTVIEESTNKLTVEESIF